ncbi:hypothetical protein F5Y12DRAFT_792753 [Xylaria sp. FL1777]|nr:hypothetical protein F5Y12DRAFT_792753 [Xylaria sp. FL1777]
MRSFLVLWLVMVLRVAAENQFISPRNYSADGQGKYAANSPWPLGSSQLIAFQTNWEEYRIELWQQPLESGAQKSSNLVYNQNVGQDLPQSFYWTVQTYELLLSDSPVFFFELQDKNSTARQASAYFNITIAPVDLMNPQAFGSSTPPSTPTTPSASTASTVFLPASSPSEQIIMRQGLSAGAAAGIGIGVSLCVVLVASVVGFVFIRRRTHQQQWPAELQGCEPVTYGHDSFPTKLKTQFDQPRMELPG